MLSLKICLAVGAEAVHLNLVSIHPVDCELPLSKVSVVFENDVYCQILGMVEANDEITLEDLANECRKLDIKCDSSRNQ
ncbi:hypothetical protein ACTXT7_001424 [Hymenolepis weldensis]